MYESKKSAIELLHNYTGLDYDTSFKIFSWPGSLFLGFFTAYLAPQFTQDFIDNYFLTLATVIIGFYLTTTILSLRYKNKFAQSVQENKDEIPEDQKKRMDEIIKSWPYYIEMVPMLVFIQAWFCIIFKEMSESPNWSYFWSSLIITSFFSLLTLLVKRYFFIDQLLQHDKTKIEL